MKRTIFILAMTFLWQAPLDAAKDAGPSFLFERSDLESGRLAMEIRCVPGLGAKDGDYTCHISLTSGDARSASRLVAYDELREPFEALFHTAAEHLVKEDDSGELMTYSIHDGKGRDHRGVFTRGNFGTPGAERTAAALVRLQDRVRELLDRSKGDK